MKPIVSLHHANMLNLVRGGAKNYTYIVCSLFEPHKTINGDWIYVDTGIRTATRRGRKICRKDGEQLAKVYNAEFSDTYGYIGGRSVELYESSNRSSDIPF